MSDDYGIQSVPPRYDRYDSFYIHTSEGYSRAVEEIDGQMRDEAAVEARTVEQKTLDGEEQRRLEEYKREQERAVLEEIRLKEELTAAQREGVSEYDGEEDSPPPGTSVDLLA